MIEPTGAARGAWMGPGHYADVRMYAAAERVWALCAGNGGIKRLCAERSSRCSAAHELSPWSMDTRFTLRALV